MDNKSFTKFLKSFIAKTGKYRKTDDKIYDLIHTHHLDVNLYELTRQQAMLLATDDVIKIFELLLNGTLDIKNLNVGDYSYSQTEFNNCYHNDDYCKFTACLTDHKNEVNIFATWTFTQKEVDNNNDDYSNLDFDKKPSFEINSI